MTKTPDPIQELVTAARRKQILDAATQVFAEKGFHRATIKDIARVAHLLCQQNGGIVRDSPSPQ